MDKPFQNDIDGSRRKGRQTVPRAMIGKYPTPARLARCQAAARHTQKRRNQDHIGEELQKDDVGCEPAEARSSKNRTKKPTRNKLVA